VIEASLTSSSQYGNAQTVKFRQAKIVENIFSLWQARRVAMSKILVLD